MFTPGEQVLCIKTGWGQSGAFQQRWCPNIPRRGVLYTIRNCYQITAVASIGPEWFVRLMEVVNPKNHSATGPVEPIFEAVNFVPLKKVKTNISVFTKILVKYNKKVKA